MTAVQASLALQSISPYLAVLSAGHALVVGGVAWYVVDAAWGSVPVAASLTPVPRVAFAAAWIGGAIYLASIASAVGAASARRGWIGPDPTECSSLSAASRAIAAWSASVILLSVVAIAPVPVYLSLWALGAVTSEATICAITYLAIVLAAPLPGLVAAFSVSRRRGG